MKTIVVARYSEDFSWVGKLKDWNVIVLNKGGGNIPNSPGREAHSYLWFITKYYDTLDGEYVFCQGNPFDHVPNFTDVIDTANYYGRLYTCDDTGAEDHKNLPIRQYADILGIPIPSKIEFRAGAQFKTTANKIKSRPLGFYLACLAKSEHDSLSGYVFERLWPYIL